MCGTSETYGLLTYRYMLEEDVHERIVRTIFECTEHHQTIATFWSWSTLFRHTVLDTLSCEQMFGHKRWVSAWTMKPGDLGPGHSQILSHSCWKKPWEKAWEHCYVMDWTRFVLLSESIFGPWRSDVPRPSSGFSSHCRLVTKKSHSKIVPTICSQIPSSNITAQSLIERLVVWDSDYHKLQIYIRRQKLKLLANSCCALWQLPDGW